MRVVSAYTHIQLGVSNMFRPGGGVSSDDLRPVAHTMTDDYGRPFSRCIAVFPFIPVSPSSACRISKRRRAGWRRVPRETPEN